MTNMMMFCKVVLLIVYGSCLASATHNYEPLEYSVPQPLIQAFRPRGLKVSIPHTTGIQLFAFHGNINKPLHGIHAGQLSGDILHRDGDHWIFSDPYVKLEIDDKIYYWLFVIKDNLGYRYSEGVYQIKEITRGSVGDCHNETRPITTEKPIMEENDYLASCEKVVMNLTQTLLDLEYEIQAAKEINGILRDLVEKHPQTALTLTLDGDIPDDDDLLFTVQAIIRQKLELHIVINHVLRKPNRRVQFQVRNLNEKLAIIRAAKEKLKHSKFAITY